MARTARHLAMGRRTVNAPRPAALADGAASRPEPRLSASVILARDGDAGLEVFMVRRHERSHNLPNAYVFPGGTVRADDREHERGALAGAGRLWRALAERADAPSAAETAALYVCALRELFEEAGVLLTQATARRRAPRGPLLAPVSGPELAAAREALQRGEVSLRGLLERWRLRPAFGLLTPFSHWVTPEGVPVRYDTWFFVAAMPEAQEALHCQVETSDGVWARPTDVLEGAARGAYGIIFPTESHLRRVAPFSSVDALLAFARAKRIHRAQPILVHERGSWHPRLAEQLMGAW